MPSCTWYADPQIGSRISRGYHCATQCKSPIMPWPTTSRHERGYGSEWIKARARILKRDMHLCQPCKANGRPTTATQVDHILSKASGGTDCDDNLQAICCDCHTAKTQAEATTALGRKPKPKAKYDEQGRVEW